MKEARSKHGQDDEHDTVKKFQGFAKETRPDKARFYHIAQGSQEEVRYYLIPVPLDLSSIFQILAPFFSLSKQ